MNQMLSAPSSAGAVSPSKKALFFWKIVQVICWFLGVVLLLIMLYRPPAGVLLFWNILIPVAPALLVIGTGVWRNVCPLGTTSLLPDRFGLSKKIKLTTAQRTRLGRTGILLLLLIIPLRHVLFNRDGQATAAVIMLLGILALISGFLFERKSGWCSGMCPIHPVEKLYGSGVAFSLPNVHCNECIRCSVPCPDSVPDNKSFLYKSTRINTRMEKFMVGGFPGYIWGWFQVPDYTFSESLQKLFIVYGYPLLGAAVSIALFILLTRFFPKTNKQLLINLFAASAVSCYYWYRLPILFGFGNLETNGTLVNLSNILPSWSITMATLVSTAFFFWWMVFRKKNRRSWLLRPRYAVP